MKELFIRVAALVLSMMVVSCSENDALEKPNKGSSIISFNVNDILVDANSSEQTLDFETKGSWSIIVSPIDVSWCSINPSKGDETIRSANISIKENELYDDRSVTITLKAGNDSKSIKVVQKQKGALILSKKSYKIKQGGGVVDVIVKANISYTINTDKNSENWIKEVSTKALVENKHSFGIEENPLCDNRLGKIYVTHKSVTDTIIVEQDVSELLSVTPNDYSTSFASSSFIAQVKSNGEYSINISDPAWIVESKREDVSGVMNITFTVSENKTAESRSSIIAFVSKNGNLKDEIIVKQTPYGFISISNNTVGTLPSRIEESIKNSVKELVVSGSLNGTDLSFIREMAGSDKNGEFTNGVLESIDISECNIVSGGDPYVFSFETEDNKLGCNMFQGCESIKYIKLPESITNIGEKAFLNCINLQKLYIPQSVTELAESIIDGCVSINSLTISKNINTWKSLGKASVKHMIIENGVTYLPQGVCDINFGNGLMPKLETLVLPKSVTHIAPYAFGYGGLKAIYIDNIEQWLGYSWYNPTYPFEGVCISWTRGNNGILKDVTINKDRGGKLFIAGKEVKEITVPSTCMMLKERAFEGCRVGKITIPNTVTKIMNLAFAGSTITEIVIPNSVSSIGTLICIDCLELEKFTLPNTISKIPERSFEGCIGLKEIVIPNNITAIDDGAFQYCVNAKTVYLSTALQTIDSYAFGTCSSIQEVHAKSKTPPTIKEFAFTAHNKENAKLYVPSGSKSSYIQSDWIKFFKEENIVDE